MNTIIIVTLALILLVTLSFYIQAENKIDELEESQDEFEASVAKNIEELTEFVDDLHYDLQSIISLLSPAQIKTMNKKLAEIGKTIEVVESYNGDTQHYLVSTLESYDKCDGPCCEDCNG